MVELLAGEGADVNAHNQEGSTPLAPRLYAAREVTQNRFKITGGRPGGEVSWQVTGIRHDAYANAHRIPVTEDKPAAEQGTYLHPDVYGQGEGRALGAGSH